ncbi:MAG: serine hydrolase [Planctomycetes bacterium]|nr:serine hydrolase [Planctomycetota bacterium]
MRTPVALLLLPSLLAQAPSRELAEVAAAYAAKVAASAIFVSGRTLDSVLAEELAPTRPLERLIRPLLRFDVDATAGTVTCKLGGATAVAVRTPNLGCVLVRPDAPLATLQQRAAPEVTAPRRDPATADWPVGDRLASTPTGIDLAALDRAIDTACRDPDDGRRVFSRAVVVLHKGQLVRERYAAGYGADSMLPGWSMTKSLTFALVLAAQQAGIWQIDVPEWRADDDGRRHITTHHLLSMTAGLAWSERYDDPGSDALRMLFASSDHAAAYTAQPIAAAAGTTYLYSSGSTNLLCRLLRRSVGDDATYWAWPRQHLLLRLGMRNTLIETDPSGTFVGSSYGFATARDWARLGLLFQQRGQFAGEQILPRQAFEAAARPAPGSRGHYGTGVWLNADPDGDGPAAREWPDLPANLMHMDGHEGQYVVVFPDEELVVVRLGCTKNGGFDLHGLLRAVRDAAAPAADTAR